MLAFILCSLALVQVIGAAIMVAKMRRAPLGYEDAAGFHHGNEPVVSLTEKMCVQAADPAPVAHSEIAPAEATERLPVWLAEPHRLAG